MVAVDVLVVDHPLARSRLTVLRDERTDSGTFRFALHELTIMLVYEATRAIAVERYPVQTPVDVAEGVRVANPPLLVPVLRAGLGMSDAALALLPDSSMGFVGLAYVPIVCAQLQNAHANPGANRNPPTRMQRDLGQISLLERLQDGLQFGTGLLEACQHSRGTTGQNGLARWQAQARGLPVPAWEPAAVTSGGWWPAMPARWACPARG